jgi:hypothetical protein
MARVFLGDQSRVDPEVLAALETLPDDFWILGEFTLRRNFDWFILRPFDDSPAALIVTEVKRRSRPLRGSLNAAWEEPTESGEWETIAPPNGEDRNYYWQAVNAANSLSEWLRNNEPVFNDADDTVWADTRVWPDLLILSPPGTTHLLPHRPDNGFGAWYFDLERWISHLRTWRPRVGPRLTQTHIQRLVDYFQLTPTESTAPYENTPEPVALTDTDSNVSELQQVSGLQHVEMLAHTVEDLSRRVAVMESMLQQTSRLLAAAGEPPAPPRELRPLRADERAAIENALRGAIAKGYVRSYPSVVKELERVLGEDLKATSYHGFGSASALFQQAARDGIIQLGPRRGPSPTIWLPDEVPD